MGRAPGSAPVFSRPGRRAPQNGNQIAGDFRPKDLGHGDSPLETLTFPGTLCAWGRTTRAPKRRLPCRVRPRPTPPRHREGISHRAHTPGDRHRGSRRLVSSPGHPWHSLNLREHDQRSHPQAPVPVVAQTHRPTWPRRAVFLRRNECQHPTGPPRGEYYPRGLPPGGESQSDRGLGARAGTKSDARGHPHACCLHWCGDRPPTIRLRGRKTHPSRHQAPRHKEGVHAPAHRPSTRPDSDNPGVAGRRSQL